MPRSVARAAVIFTRGLLRCALPSADRACRRRTWRVALRGGDSETRVRTGPVADSPLLTVRGLDSVRAVSGEGAAHGFIDDVLGHVSQFAVVSLAHRPQLGARGLGAAPGTSPDEADRLIDHRARRQRRLQLDGESKRVREDLRVVHSDSRWLGEQFPEFGGVLIEDVFAMGVHVDRPDNLIRQQQRQRQRTVYTQPAYARTEPRPHLLPTQRPGTHGAPFQRRRNAGALMEGHALDFDTL